MKGKLVLKIWCKHCGFVDYVESKQSIPSYAGVPEKCPKCGKE